MKIILSFAIILLYQLIGNTIQYALKLPIPGTVIGLVLLFLTLVLGQKHFKIKYNNPFVEVSLSLISILPILYVPAGVGIIKYFDVIKSQSIPIIGTLFISAIISMALVAWLMSFILKLTDKNTESDYKTNRGDYYE